MSKQSAARKRAHAELDDYIDWLIENGSDIAATDGTDGWTLTIDQWAHSAASEEAEHGK